MGLNEKEIEMLIKKLRDKYLEYGRKHNRSWFNADAFEERLRMATVKRMNLEGFILAEIANFEKTRERYDKKKAEKPFAARVESIMEENLARMKKYPAIYFHELAELETTHFYGALSEFALNLLPVLRVLVSDAAIKDRIRGIEERLGFLAIPMGRKHSKRILDHMLVLSRPPGPAGNLEAEKDKSAYLREGAFVLHEILDLCDELLEMRSPEWEGPLRFDRLHIDGERKSRMLEVFSGLTGYGAIVKIRERCAEILDDFRLGAFRERKA